MTTPSRPSPGKERLDNPLTILLSASMLAALEEGARQAGLNSPRVYARSILVRHLRQAGHLTDTDKPG